MCMLHQSWNTYFWIIEVGFASLNYMIGRGCWSTGSVSENVWSSTLVTSRVSESENTPRISSRCICMQIMYVMSGICSTGWNKHIAIKLTREVAVNTCTMHMEVADSASECPTLYFRHFVTVSTSQTGTTATGIFSYMWVYTITVWDTCLIYDMFNSTSTASDYIIPRHSSSHSHLESEDLSQCAATLKSLMTY